MKRWSFVVLFLMVFLCANINDVYAHPGRTDSNGCHTCRTNCEKWGLSYGQYHCHNSGSNGSSASKSYVQQYVYGCTDPNSVNYNSGATKDDGSCIKKVYGCMDSNAYNYNFNANTDDGSCIAKIYGCIDSSANNYNEEANISDGSCLYTKYKTRYKKIKYKTKYQYRFFSKKGKVLRKGKNGKKMIKSKLTINENGDVVATEIVKENVMVKPVSKIIVTKKK